MASWPKAVVQADTIRHTARNSFDFIDVPFFVTGSACPSNALEVFQKMRAAKKAVELRELIHKKRSNPQTIRLDSVKYCGRQLPRGACTVAVVDDQFQIWLLQF